ncbi:GerAB/ArcD/ProY family transporter [Bacillus pacificus]
MESIAVSLWILVIFPNLCIILFISSKGVKQIFHLKLKTWNMGNLNNHFYHEFFYHKKSRQ